MYIYNKIPNITSDRSGESSTIIGIIVVRETNPGLR
ncbi:hypothetical protein Pan241w_41380 [Gimesia alba]|uniref:Uncharacterized protein n=1 Tax=Gimesia alba TaxID=2527973 RepID=A0A517RJJ2_9PLAN|nr:hypothetical protein Pan241w_41380 [Gimesia alba]